MLLFKTYTLEFEFERRLEQMVSYQEMQSGLPVFLVGEFGAFEIFIQIDGFQSLIFRISQTENIKNISIWIEYDHILQFANHKQVYFDSGLFVKLKT